MEREKDTAPRNWILTPVSRLIAQEEFTAFLTALQREYNTDRGQH
jgi:hypothetical protein